MKKLALALAVSGAFALVRPFGPRDRRLRIRRSQGSRGSDAAAAARQDMFEAFGETSAKAGSIFVARRARQRRRRASSSASATNSPSSTEGARWLRSRPFPAAAGKNPTPTGIFPILEKKRFHRSIKYDNAPMPFMQRIDRYGIALHGGHLPGHPASHGCIRLPGEFAAKLFRVTDVGTPVLIGA